MTPGKPQTAIVTCMDARLDATRFLDLWPEAMYVTRNAGGRVTADVLRSLAVSCAMGTKRIVVVHHTDCAMAAHSDEQIRDLLPPGVEAEIDFLTIAEAEKALQQDVQTIKDSPLLPPGTEVLGFIYDLDAQTIREPETALRPVDWIS